ncbi:MAG TPA: tetratricopeptide repeat protein [Bacteroidales bacterium]|nr:tetratricopeptide repeat protein [Bacteroidales bacterium]
MRQRRVLLLFFICISFFAHAVSVESLYTVDTLFITDKQGIIQSHKEITDILKKADASKKAELFYNTGYALANKPKPTQKDIMVSISYISIAAEYYKIAKSYKEYATCLENLATLNYELSKYEKAVSLFQESIDVHTQFISKETSHIALLHTNIAFIFFNTFRYENAIRFFTIAQTYYTTLKDTLGTGKTLYYKGLVFYENNQLDSALMYYEQSLSYDILLKNKQEMFASYNNIAVVYTKKRSYNQALSYLQKASQLLDKIENNQSKQSMYYINIGNVYFHKKQYDKALENYNNALDIKKEIKDNNGIAICIHNIANVLIEQKKLTEAKNKLNESLALTETPYPNELYGSICKTTSRLYELMNNGEKALFYYELYVKNTISILTEDTGQISETGNKHQEGALAAAALQREIKMQQMLASYDFKIKKDSIQALEAKRKEGNTRLYMYIGIVLFILLAGGILLNRYFLKKRANAKLEDQNREIAQQNIIIAQQTHDLIESNQELEKLSIVASKTDNAILIMNSEGYFEWVNEAYTNIFGYTFEELCSQISDHMIGPSTPQYVVEKFNECREKKITVQYEVETKNKAKEPIWIQVTLTPILNAEGELHRLVMIDSDITQIKKAENEIIAQKNQIEQQKEEQLQQRDNVIAQSKEIEAKKEELAATLEQLQTAQNKLVESEKMAQLGSLVAGISHEINTPVGVGLAASSSLSTRTAEIIDLFQSKKMKLSDLQVFLETVQHASDLILKNLHRTAELVKSFNQVSVDNMTEQKREFNLHEYLHDITRSLAPKFKGRNIQISITCDQSIVLVSYPGAFAQIFTNFIVNSLMHAFDETDTGSITIEIIDTDSSYTCIYSDNGKGIPKDNQAKVFDAFFTTNTKEGTGLGMNITYNLVTQKLGGEIQLWSDEGQGVRFTIVIPKQNIVA